MRATKGTAFLPAQQGVGGVHGGVREERHGQHGRQLPEARLSAQRQRVRKRGSQRRTNRPQDVG